MADTDVQSSRRVPRRFVVGTFAALVLGTVGPLVGAPAASANLEFVKSFAKGEIAEGGSLSSTMYLAVNEHTGDLYEADAFNHRILRFNEHGVLLEGWGWGAGDGKQEFERCGPDGEPAYPECLGRSAEIKGKEQGWAGEGPGEFNFDKSVAVDQTTGDVYVSSRNRAAGGDIVQVFTESGELLASFAPHGPAESEIETPGPIAVDSSGDVYVGSSGGARGWRVVEYVKKSASEYTFSREVLHGVEEVEFLYAAANGSLFAASFTEVLRFDPPNFATPAWEHSLLGAKAVSINAENGEVFYYGKLNKFHEFKPRGHDELESPTGEVGKEELFEGQPGEETALASIYDPSAEETGHGRGVFYAGVEINKNIPEHEHMILFAPPGVFPPVVEAETVESAGAASVGLGAVLNDEHFPAQYRFEYGPEPCSTSSCASSSPAELAPVSGPQHVSATIGGLESGTTYYYRVTIATHCNPTEPSKECIEHGPDKSFTTFASPASTLPDHRGYELVTPADKNGGEIFPLDPAISSCGICEPGVNNPRQPVESTSDGSAIAYEGLPFSPSGEAVDENEYRSSRTPTGWQTVDLTPLHEHSHEAGYRTLSGSLEEGVLAQATEPLAPGAPSETEELYLRSADGTLQPLLDSSSINFNALENPLKVEYGGAASGFQSVVFLANGPLTGEVPGVAPPAPKVSEKEFDVYSWAGGNLSLVNVLPGNAKAVAGAVLGAGKELASTAESAPDYSNAVSPDGSRIFWSNPATGQAYVRVNGATTFKLPDTARFLTASSDGNSVLLSDGRAYLVGEGGITLSADVTTGQGGFVGLLGASSSLTRVYFVDSNVLTSEAGPLHTKAQSGADNAYVYSDGRPRFIATLLPSDNVVNVSGVSGDWQASPSDRFAQTTPDGSYLAFMSTAPLTGYDNHATNGACDESATHACFEVFEYSLEGNTLTCVSCNRASVPPAGESRLSQMHPIGSRMPQPRNLTKGGRLFFDSFDALTLEDRNPGAENVYEYERSGQGTCEAAEGCVRLISSGRGTSDSSFLSADETGANVFFATREQLLPEDQDELMDVYDAREGGGFPPASTPLPCRGEGCLPVSPPSATPSPATAQDLPPEASVSPYVAQTPRLSSLKAKVKRGKLILTIRTSSAAVVKISGSYTKTKTVKLGAEHSQQVSVVITRKGLRLLRRHRKLVASIVVQMSGTRVVRHVRVAL